MPSADVIAIGALIVSVASAIAAVLAWRTSVNALKFSQTVHGEATQNAFQKLRAELLMNVSESRRQLDRARIDIATLQAAFVAEPQPVQVLLAQYRESLFEDFLPRIAAAIAQLDDMWRDISGWAADKPYSELMAVKAVLYRCSKEDEVVVDSANYMMAEYRNRLTKAKEYVAGATK